MYRILLYHDACLWTIWEKRSLEDALLSLSYVDYSDGYTAELFEQKIILTGVFKETRPKWVHIASFDDKNNKGEILPL